ncbi:Zinc finger CCCH domain-containing protein 32 [Rhynchospora pubera]|uniref:Zinc finger CCCH domain-containing protein 32 n=1 Tax=Rhynchospora pubera TaxID=906938 RepID=A0AAV8BNS5_9POAL|nr:Zinc finger CCCH domain-containing protein 32 [Rhynchospora pubera]KAJ4806112.1 Zinc finger CCCH domain-containing protein 32 [Rhynchospora pubera]
MESGGIRPPAAAAATAGGAPPVQLTAEEEAIKRNTDCVYFLASPLTCKKGSECEYRHSEGARVNPRDCFYWINSNCTNRKCAFRHPPLESIFGVLPTPAVPAAALAAGYNPMKQSTPCYYFQKGNCLKGDRCPFMHGPPSTGTNTVPQQPTKVSAAPIGPSNPAANSKPTQNSSFSTNNTKPTQDKLVPNASKPVHFNGPSREAPAITKPRAAITVNNAHQLPYKSVPAVNSSDEGHLRLPHTQFPSSKGTPVQNQERSDERPQDSREGDEFLGESSPGFDVIVDHDEEDSRYMPPNEEDYRRAFADPYDPSEMYPVDDYELMSRYDRDRNHIMSEHDYEPEFDHEVNRFEYKGNDQYDRKRRRRDSSSEHVLDRPSRRQSYREEAGIGAETDLRHRLMNKQRRLDGSTSRSDVSADKQDDRSQRQHNRREERYMEERERHRNRGTDRTDLLDRGAMRGGGRLQGRIKMPLKLDERSDFVHGEIEMERGRHLRGSAKVSPVAVEFSSGYHHERMRQRSNDRVFVAQMAARRDDGAFSGPKRLSELKSVKGTDKVSEGKTKDFEGPMSLSEILKKKREAAGMASGNGSSSETKGHDDDTSPKGRSTDTALDEQEVEEGMISEGNGTSYKVEVTSKVDGADEKEFEDDQEMEEPDDEIRGEDPNYYEGEEGEEYRMEDENAYQEEGEEANEYPEGEEGLEDDDEDEEAFARKVGVVLS